MSLCILHATRQCLGGRQIRASCWSAGVSCWVVRSARCGSCLLMISWCFGPRRGCPGTDLLWAGERQQKRQQPRHTTSLEDLRHPSFGTCDVGGACHRKVMGSICYLGTKLLSLGANFEILSGLLISRTCSVPRRQHGLELNVVVVRRISQTACEQPRASAVNAHKPEASRSPKAQSGLLLSPQCQRKRKSSKTQTITLPMHTWVSLGRAGIT